MNAHVIAAIFRRNFVSYFSNPTGYVFICVFVLLGSFAAFWPDEFFNTNLANLDQLNQWFPYIMLVFIPAITMSIWADEKRQGTDELLLTIPAGDIDVVLGKYLAAVAIYSVALLFSLVCNLAVLYTLGQPDHCLFLGTYFGYWMVGLAMLAMGMVASFLTGNLTVAFILGVAFNAPLVFLNVVDVDRRGNRLGHRPPRAGALAKQMNDFGRGVISLSSIVYFLMIAVVMLYLCMVLIGRRHWLGGHDGKTLGPHYVVRTLALAVLAVGVKFAGAELEPAGRCHRGAAEFALARNAEHDFQARSAASGGDRSLHQPEFARRIRANADRFDSICCVNSKNCRRSKIQTKINDQRRTADRRSDTAPSSNSTFSRKKWCRMTTACGSKIKSSWARR